MVLCFKVFFGVCVVVVVVVVKVAVNFVKVVGKDFVAKADLKVDVKVVGKDSIKVVAKVAGTDIVVMVVVKAAVKNFVKASVV